MVTENSAADILLMSVRKLGNFMAVKRTEAEFFKSGMKSYYLWNMRGGWRQQQVGLDNKVTWAWRTDDLYFLSV